jgi:hypothetical protein
MSSTQLIDQEAARSTPYTQKPTRFWITPITAHTTVMMASIRTASWKIFSSELANIQAAFVEAPKVFVARANVRDYFLNAA